MKVKVVASDSVLNEINIGDKIKCVDASKQKVLVEGGTYTVMSIDAFGRVYIEEWKRFAFSPERFVIV